MGQWDAFRLWKERGGEAGLPSALAALAAVQQWAARVGGGTAVGYTRLMIVRFPHITSCNQISKPIPEPWTPDPELAHQRHLKRGT